MEIRPRVYADGRGFFEETFSREAFLGCGIDVRFIQDNHSFSKKGVLRGMHWQNPPHTQGKLIFVACGRIWDVAVDIRKNSPTHGKWISRELSSENRKMLWIPGGFAHGFYAMEDSHVIYKCTAPYDRNSEASFRWDDKNVAIGWPEGISPLLSEKDAAAMPFSAITPLPQQPWHPI